MSVYRGVVTITHPSIGGTGTNTWHVRTDSIGDGGDVTLGVLSEMIHTFYDAINDRFAGGTVAAFDGEWQQIDSGGDALIGVDSWSVAVAGSEPPLPPQDCLVASWRTTGGGRSGRGRTFLSPMRVTTLQDNGSPTEAARAQIVAAGNALIGSSSGLANGAVGVWSVKDEVLRDFTAVACRNVFGVLRSRRD